MPMGCVGLLLGARRGLQHLWVVDLGKLSLRFGVGV